MNESMNIYAKHGDKVIYHGEGGYDIDREIGNKYLIVGQTYTVDYTDVGGWMTDVYLQEFPDIPFNSVNFYDKE